MIFEIWEGAEREVERREVKRVSVFVMVFRSEERFRT